MTKIVQFKQDPETEDWDIEITEVENIEEMQELWNGENITDIHLFVNEKEDKVNIMVLMNDCEKHYELGDEDDSNSYN